MNVYDVIDTKQTKTILINRDILFKCNSTWIEYNF